MTHASHRDVVLADSAMIADLFARSFVETFGPLYRSDDLAAFLAGITPEPFAEEIASREFALRVAESDGEPVGFAKLGPPSVAIETPPGTLELRQIYVLKPWQGKGVAQSLFGWAEEEARRRCAGHLQLTVYIDNHRAKRFYARYGFADVGRHAFMVGNHADEDIVMRKPL